MDASEQLKEDVRQGRIPVERLLDIIASLQRRLEAALQRIEELEKKPGQPTPPGAAKLDQPFSVRAEEKRQRRRGHGKPLKLSRRGRRGRLNTADKLKLAERTVACFPEGLDQGTCWLSHTRPVWRLEQGRAVLIAYQIYRGPGNRYGQIPGVLGRGEFGMEIILEIAYLVYIVGLSFAKVCEVLKFLQLLPLGKTQVDALLQRLARHWQHEFDVLCTLLANSLVVHADETSWSINSVWAFLSEKARLLFFGVHKDADTLHQILDPKSFAGLLISDDYAVYGNFTQAQKCWAHLLRKAIKLTLQEPANADYRKFADGLLAIYRAACRVQRDGRLGDAGRQRKVGALEDDVLELCSAYARLQETALREGLENDYRLLVGEVLRLAVRRELFMFVTTPAAAQPNGQSKPVSGTNNESERKLRDEARARDTGRTNKTSKGARRQTIVVSVLESLRLYLRTFTLSSIIAEVQRWQRAGKSCFTRLLQKMKLLAPDPTKSILDKVLSIPDG
jgi:hypothetical protein